MLAFMAYPPPPHAASTANPRTTAARGSDRTSRGAVTSRPAASTNPCHDTTLGLCDTSRTSATTASMDEAPPQSVLSLSTEASSDILLEDHDDHVINQPDTAQSAEEEEAEEEKIQRRAQQCCTDNDNSENDNEADHPQRPTTTFGVPRVYIEKLYENTVDGPCQTVTMCEIEHMDLFMNCQQPLSFLGFGGHHHHDDSRRSSVVMDHSGSFHHEEEEDDRPLPGAYDVPKGCEYCGASHTNQCQHNTSCRRPQLFFHKKIPPFARPDAALWDPVTDEAIYPRSDENSLKNTQPHSNRNLAAS